MLHPNLDEVKSACVGRLVRFALYHFNGYKAEGLFTCFKVFMIDTGFIRGIRYWIIMFLCSVDMPPWLLGSDDEAD